MTVGELVQAIGDGISSALDAIKQLTHKAYTNVLATEITDILLWSVLALGFVGALAFLVFINGKYEEKKRARRKYEYFRVKGLFGVRDGLYYNTGVRKSLLGGDIIEGEFIRRDGIRQDAIGYREKNVIPLQTSEAEQFLKTWSRPHAD